MLRTAGGAPLRVGAEPVLNERDRPNQLPAFTDPGWVLSGGARVTSEGYLELPAVGARAVSPFIRVGGADYMTWSCQIYTDQAAPSFTPDGGRLFNSAYYAEDKVTAVANSLGNTSNGNARKVTRGAWSDRTVAGGWTINGGPNVMWARWTITVDSSYSSPPLLLRDPMGVAVYNFFSPYAHYFRKGL